MEKQAPSIKQALKQALLIVDVQEGFFNKHTKAIPALVQELQHDYEYVFATQFINRGEGYQFVEWLKWKRFMEGSEDVELAFEPRKDTEIIEKHTYSSCVDTNFLESLSSKGIKEVHICGIDTDICVLASAVGLFDYGHFKPVVLSKYCASHAGKDYHDAALKILRRYIGEEQVI